MRSKHKIKEEINEQWPESARTVMLEKQEWYDHPRIYQYGFYDGYQHAVAESVGERADIARKDKLIEQMRAIIIDYRVEHKAWCNHDPANCKKCTCGLSEKVVAALAAERMKK